MYRVWVEVESGQWVGHTFQFKEVAWSIRDLLLDSGYTQVRVKAEGEYGYDREGDLTVDLLDLPKREFERS